MRKRNEDRLKTILYTFVSIAIIIFSFNKFCTYKVKNFLYRGISMENMLDDLYGKDFGIWKTKIDGMRIVTNYTTKDNRINLNFVGGFVDGVEFADMKVNGMDLDGEKKTSYINGMNEEYRKKHNMPYGSTLTSSSEVYLGNQDESQNSGNGSSNIQEEEPSETIKEISKQMENGTFKNNSEGYYNVNKNLPGGTLSFLDEYVERLKNSCFPNSNYRFAEVYQYEGEFSMGEEFKNGYYVYISTNNKMGNYTFKIFCDASEYSYYVESVKDKDNGKTYDTVKAINIYLNDVINRYEKY